MHDELRAGLGRANITPSLTVPHAGWGAQTHLLADGIHQDLYVTALVLQQGELSTAMVEFDLVGLYALADPIRAAVSQEIGIPEERVRVGVTHNHANPVMWDNWIGARADRVAAYRASLPDRAAGAARQAWLSLKPARLATGRGHCAIGRNRRQKLADDRVVVGRNDEGVGDPEVFVVRLDDLEGRPLAGIMGYTCHPTTLGPDNRLVSPDYPGVAKRVFEEVTGAPCLFLQGAAGNVGPVMGFTGDISIVERLGTILGLEAAKVFTGLNTRPVREVFDSVRESGASLGIWKEEPVPEVAAKLQVSARPLEVPVRPQPTVEEVESEYEHRRVELERVMHDGSPPAVVEATMFQARRAQMALARAQTYGGKTHVRLELHLIAYGDVAIVGVNGEPFCQIGLAIKEKSPFKHTFFGGYTGPSYGYIPWPSEYADGGYEVETSPYPSEVAPLMVDAAVRALRELAEG